MISLNKLSFSYPKQDPLFHHLDLEIDAGNIIGLLGKNGSGKTSLLKLLCGLIFNSSGKLEVMKNQPKQRHPQFLGQVFMVPEEFYLPTTTIDEFIKANSGFYPRFNHDLMDRLLADCELSRNLSIQKISFGQKKKFLITFALATKCRLLLLDEPTNGLDIPSKSVFRKMVAGSLDEDQLVIIATHQVRDIEHLVDKILILDQGKVIFNRSLHEISDRLHFGRSTTLDPKKVVYSEKIAGAYHTITTETQGDSPVDMELLFNAVTKGTQIFKI